MNWLIGGKTAEIKRLIAQLNDPNKAGRAAQELIRLGAEAAPYLIQALPARDPSVPPLIQSILLRMGAAATPALTQALNKEPPAVRIQICDLLGQIQDRAALPALLDALHNNEYLAVRAQAALALARFADPLAIPPLLAMLNSHHPELRAAAVLALSAFADETIIAKMAALLLDDPEISVRQAAARALGKTQHPAALPYLLEALHDSFWWYEREGTTHDLLDALQAMGTLAVEALIEALNDRERTVRQFAAQLLGRIGDPRALEPLGMALYDLHFQVGEAAAQALARFGDAGLPFLVEALKHPEASIRQQVIKALAEIGNTDVFPLLAEMIYDPDRNVQKQAIQALGQLGDPRARSMLQPIAESRTDRELATLARTALQFLIRN